MTTTKTDSMAVEPMTAMGQDPTNNGSKNDGSSNSLTVSFPLRWLRLSIWDSDE